MKYYVLIFEDGNIALARVIGEDEIQAVKDGVLSIIECETEPQVMGDDGNFYSLNEV